MNYNFDDERKKIDDDLSIYNQALNDLISRQQNDEQKILNDQDLGSRALRIFRVAKNGGDTSNIYNEYKQDLNTKLQNNSNKYKQMRDELLQKSKDTLARRDALDKFKYSMEQDQIKNDLANREFGLRTKTQANQNAIQQAQLDILRNQNTAKQNQAVQDQINQQNLEDAAYTNLEYLGNFALDPKEYNRLSDNKRTKQATINLFNREYAKAMGVKEENIADWITENPSLPSMNDNFATQNAKMKALLLQAPGGKRAYTKQQEEKRKATFTETKKLIDDATPGSFISFPSMPNEQFLVTVDKTLFKDGKEYKLDDDGKFIELK